MSFRLDRQRRVFEADPAKELEFIVTDDVLRTEFGGARVLSRQIEHVLRTIDEHPKLRFRLVSSTAPHNPAPHGGFTLLRFPEPAPPVGFMSVAYGSSPYLDDPADTEALRRAFERLQEIALDPAESRLLIERSLPRS